jgi:hypothetical protein
MEVDDMRKLSARIFEKLLQLLLPGQGRHRAERPVMRRQDEPTMRTAPAPQAPALAASMEYMNASDQREREQRAERRLRRRRRQALWLAVHGVDMGPRWIHGVRVVA